MEQIVYGDLLFLINFSMDFLCLFLVARLMSRPFSLFRGSAASVLGGLYAVATVFVAAAGPAEILIHLGICLVMCLVTFAGKNESPSSILILSAAFLLASFLLGGIMTAVFNLMNHASPPDDLSESHHMPLWLFAAVAAVSSAAAWIGGRFLRARSQIQSADLEIRLGRRRTVIRAMCDSGNLLRDSVSGKPVIVADRRHAVNLLPADCQPITDWSTGAIASLPPSVATRVRIIPLGTAGSQGTLLALRPDSIVIRVAGRTRTADALIGFTDIKNTPDGISAIIPPELIT